MNFHPEKLQSLLKIDLHDMIDHALGIQSLKVMRAYVRMLQEQRDLAHRLIQQQEIALIKEALQSCKFNQKKTAEHLGMTYHQLRGYLRKYEINDSED